MKSSRLFFLCVGLIVMLLGPVFFPDAVYANFASRVTSGYEKMPSELPDDRGLYDSSTTAIYNNSPTNISAGRVGQKVDDGRPHQYLTLGGSVIDNNGGNRKCNYIDGCYSTVYLKVYTRHPGTSKKLFFDFVDRRVNIDGRGVSDCSGGDLKLAYFSGSAGIEIEESPRVSAVVDPNRDCARYTPDSNIPASAFEEYKIDIPGSAEKKSTGIYEAILRIKLADKKTQSSFRLGAYGDVKFGYQGPDKKENLLMADGRYYVNFYGTKLADHHQLKFYWKPPCSVVRQGADIDDIQKREYISDIRYDDVDQYDNVIQPDLARLDRYRDGARLGGSYTIQPDDYLDPLKMPIGDFTYGNPPGFELIFNNINGGNGIGFQHNYSSINYFMPCPGGDEWRLQNSSQLVNDIGAYDARKVPDSSQPSDYYPGMNCNESNGPARCREWNDFYDYMRSDVYQRTRIQHSVWNPSASPDSAKNDDHKSFIEYRVKRASSDVWRNSQNGDTGDNAWQRKSDSASRTLTPGGAPLLVNDDGTSDYSIPRSVKGGGYRGADLAFLLKACSTGNNCDDAQVGMRTPTVGDQYCERVVTVPYQMTEGVPDPAKQYSKEVCVTLGVTTCQEFPWSVNASSQVSQSEGNGEPSAAWVGDRYSFDYDFKKEGSAPQTKNIGFTYNNNGNNVNEGSRTLGSWSKSYPLGPLSPADGGRTFTSSMNYTPARSGDPNNCGSTGSETAGPHSVTVPYFFSAQSNIEVASSYEQGDEIRPEATYSMPKGDGGRDYTWTDNSTYQVTQLIYEKGYAPPTKDAVSNDAQNLCADVSYVTDAAKVRCSTPIGQSAPNTLENYIVRTGDGATHLMPTNGAQQPMGQVPATLDTNTLPAGTKVCYVASLSRPTQNANPSWYHSAMDCTTIVKKPKVQFLGGDLTVGRAPAQGSAGECPGNPEAIIQTAATSVRTDNIYGSWVEFGAFAPGVISQFGSGAYPAKKGDTSLTKDAYKKLLFANTFTGSATQTPGRYTYAAGAECLSNAFNMVSTTSDGTFNIIGDNDGVTKKDGAYTIVPGDYFSQPNRTTRAFDKTGYATEPGANLVLGKPVESGSGVSSAPADSEVIAANNTYKVSPRLCSSVTSTPPNGMTYKYGNYYGIGAYANNQQNTKSSGCNTSGNYIKTWLSAERRGGDYSAWTYTAPSGTSVNGVTADYIVKLIPWGGAKDLGVYVAPTTDGRSTDAVYSCTTWIEPNCYKTTGQTVCWDLGPGCPDNSNSSSTQSKNDHTYFTGKDYPAVSFGLECSTQGNTGADCQYSNDEGSIAVRNIDITLNDKAVPQVTRYVWGGLYKDGPANNGTIRGGQNYTLEFDAADGQSGLGSYTVQYRNQDGDWISIVNRAAFSGSTARTTFDPAVLGRGVSGNFDFRFVIYDKVGNQTAPQVWTKRVDNTNALGADYDAFTGRNIVVYARKDPSKTCQEAGAGGTMTISDNITYKTEGYASIADLPRVIFMADCNIVINDNVTQIDAWLISGNDVRTCGQETYQKFRDGTVTEADCATQLTVNGAVQAKRLVLLRTYGADQVAAPGLAETFNLRSEQLISTWVQGQTSGVTRPIYETELPPRW